MMTFYWMSAVSFCVAVSLCGCGAEDAKAPDASVVPGDAFGDVENGSAYDAAVVDTGGAKKLVVPNSAEVRQEGEAGKIQIFMRKTLSFAGHPPAAMKIKQWRNNMGCAKKTDNDSLQIATFGEWDSHREGGADMGVLIVAPKGINIERRKDLSGEESLGHLNSKVSAKEGHWYGAAGPGNGFEAIPSAPDKERRAEKVAKNEK